MHVQRKPTDWPRAVKQYPDGGLVKSVNEIHFLAEVKEVQPGTVRSFRHWHDDLQQYGLDWEWNLAKARKIFARADVESSTFLSRAHAVDIIEGSNEDRANSQNADEKKARLLSDQAYVKVWQEIQARQPDLRHIKLAICNTACGNDIPVEAAELAVNSGNLLGYHPYIPVYLVATLSEISGVPGAENRAQFRDWEDPDLNTPYLVDVPDFLNEVRENQWSYRDLEAGMLSPGGQKWVYGRPFEVMEPSYGGIKPTWYFGEGGPVQDYSGTLLLNPCGGWWTLWGEIGPALEVWQAYIYYLKSTPAWKENRIVGPAAWFTVGATDWPGFNTLQPELDQLAQATQIWSTNPAPAPTDWTAWKRKAWATSVQVQIAHGISLNAAAALQGAIAQDGLQVVHSETTVDGIVIQAAEDLSGQRARRVYYWRGGPDAIYGWFNEPVGWEAGLSEEDREILYGRDGGTRPSGTIDLVEVALSPGCKFSFENTPEPVAESPGSEGQIDYKVVVNLLPQDASQEQYLTLSKWAYPRRETVLFSADDAARLVAPGAAGSLVRVHGASHWSGDIEAWLKDHGVDVIEFEPLEDEWQLMNCQYVADVLPTNPDSEWYPYDQRNLDVITNIVIHHTVSVTTPEGFARYHTQSRGWPGIGYHYLVYSDGRIYQTNNLPTISYHTGYPGNDYSIGVALVGDFTYAPPSQIAQDRARQLVHYLRDVLGGLSVTPHRLMPGAATQCPGNTYRDWFPYVAGV